MNNEFRLNQLANGLEFLGKLLMASNGNGRGRNGVLENFIMKTT